MFATSKIMQQKFLLINFQIFIFCGGNFLYSISTTKRKNKEKGGKKNLLKIKIITLLKNKLTHQVFLQVQTNHKGYPLTN